MLKPIVSIMAAAMILSPLAVAGEKTPITVSIAYDKDMLATKAGAAEVLDAITDQAKDACTSYVHVFGGNHTDRKCVRSSSSPLFRRSGKSRRLKAWKRQAYSPARAQ